MTGPGSGGAADAARGASSDPPAADPTPTMPPATSSGASPVLPRIGGLDSLLTTGPVFSARVHGYDRLEVDNYVAWAESELTTVRREVDHLLARYGTCAAELEISRRLLAETPRGRDVLPVSDRVRDIFRLAAEEASSMVESASAEADQIVAEARLEADERLRKAHEIKQLAAATADEMRERAQRDRDEATALLERARAEADTMVGGATAERDRLAAEAAAARDQLAVVQAEVEDVRRQRDDARAVLRRLTEQIEAALELATAGPTERYLLVGNAVVDRPVDSSQGVSVPS
jgi:cell division septum initiation protein DivIVA